jgi:hypothetical protein
MDWMDWKNGMEDGKEKDDGDEGCNGRGEKWNWWGAGWPTTCAQPFGLWLVPPTPSVRTPSSSTAAPVPPLESTPTPVHPAWALYHLDSAFFFVFVPLPFPLLFIYLFIYFLYYFPNGSTS